MRSFKKYLKEAQQPQVLKEASWKEINDWIQGDVEEVEAEEGMSTARRFKDKIYQGKYITPETYYRVSKNISKSSNSNLWDLVDAVLSPNPSKIDQLVKKFDKYTESTKVITEARKIDDRKVDFDNLGGGIQFTRGIHGLYANMFSGGNGFTGEWNSKEYMNAVTSNDSHVFDDYLENTEKKLVKELTDLCSKFDKDFERLMNKYRFKK